MQQGIALLLEQANLQSSGLSMFFRKHTILLLLPLSLPLFGCDSDEPVRPTPRSRSAQISATPAQIQAANAGIQSLNGDAAQQRLWAVQGRRLRRGQDDMLRVEAASPGFAGYYVDANEQVVLLQKRSVAASTQALRQLVFDQYATDPSSVTRGIMSRSLSAPVVAVNYSISELVAWERLILTLADKIPGFTGDGVRVAENTVTVTIEDPARAAEARAMILSLGVPQDALNLEANGPLSLTSKWTDVHRPTKAGVMITMRHPNMPGNQQYSLTHGYNVRRASQPDTSTVFLTAAHGPNHVMGVNGHTGLTVHQAQVALGQGAIGTITHNPPWSTGPICFIGGIQYDFCTLSDVALGTFNAGIGRQRKVGTSVYAGVNGNWGTQDINGWYNITGVMDPDVVPRAPSQVHKSGYRSGTTSGYMLQESFFNATPTMLWGYPWPASSLKKLYFGGFVRMTSMGWGSGDSGAPVFVHNAACGPYCAIGIQSLGEGTYDLNGKCTAGTNCAVLATPWSSIEFDLGLGQLDPKTTP